MNHVMQPWYQVVYYNLSDKLDILLHGLNQLEKLLGTLEGRNFLEGHQAPGIADFNIWSRASHLSKQTVAHL